MLEQLLRDLNSNDPQVRQKAIREARELSSDDLYTLVLAAAKVRSNLVSRVAVCWIVGLCIFPVGMLATCATGAPSILLGTLLLFLLIGIGGSVWGRDEQNLLQGTLAAIFEDIEDPRFTLVLLNMLMGDLRDEHAQRIVRRSLAQLLPKVRADQAHYFLSCQGRFQYLLENHWQDRVLMLALLQFLEQVGTPGLIPYIVSFARRQQVQQDAQLYGAAHQCIEYLSLEYQKMQLGMTLLRPSQAAAYQPETLLRPVVPQLDATLPQELLRPQPASEENKSSILR